tara:strand:+ start:105 stop:371 length:267 start_codon:yes stop_codon:yes gene_type:complete
MYINIKHNINWWEGGIEIDEIIRGFCKRLDMVEGNYSKYTPCYQYLQYENTTMNQFKKIKKRLLNSKRLNSSIEGKIIEIKVEGNEFI